MHIKRLEEEWKLSKGGGGGHWVAGRSGDPKLKDRVEVKSRKIMGRGSEGGRRQSSFTELLDEEETNSSQPSPFVQTNCQPFCSHKNSTKSCERRKSELPHM